MSLAAQGKQFQEMSRPQLHLPEPLTPPLKYNAVQPGLFRGAYPRPINYRFLASLGLRTIVSLTPEPISETTDAKLFAFCEEHGVQRIHIECSSGGSKKGKKRAIAIDYAAICKAIEIVIDRDNEPVYVHCINGGQITSLFVACLRKLSFWSSIAIFNEFINYSVTINHNDRVFIENFEASIRLPKNRVDWVWNGLSQGVIDNHPTLKFYDYDE
ncbi:unnamed protein product [Kuraishia capsulata CBS 1993]|uniref:Tyrosine-protein phosphatase OCA6 n=1 Tax=Kuraishia capsulata CBS 1993 TaxID=1382522 RepID=W6MXR8_9ASCO|nr:uncharacterized protein KUCA_T00005353001 [Kuraishia capsulata CBS 1993]CDK29365.1 unnamed protein product [Kuraishia capsulata CBS 1993]